MHKETEKISNRKLDVYGIQIYCIEDNQRDVPSYTVKKWSILSVYKCNIK